MKKKVAPRTIYDYLKLFDKATAVMADNPDPDGFHRAITGTLPATLHFTVIM